jgi:hypothetical protein
LERLQINKNREDDNITYNTTNTNTCKICSFQFIFSCRFFSNGFRLVFVVCLGNDPAKSVVNTYSVELCCE